MKRGSKQGLTHPGGKIISWVGSRAEPKGFGSSVTNLFPLPCPGGNPVSKGATSARLRMTTAEGSAPAVIKQRRPGPKQPADALPASRWPTVLRCVVEKKEPLRKVAAAYGVSPETIRRLLQRQKPHGQQEA